MREDTMDEEELLNRQNIPTNFDYDAIRLKIRNNYKHKQQDYKEPKEEKPVVDFQQLGSEQRKKIREYRMRQYESLQKEMLKVKGTAKVTEYTKRYVSADKTFKHHSHKPIHSPSPAKHFPLRTAYKDTFDRESHVSEVSGKKLARRYQEEFKLTKMRTMKATEGTFKKVQL